jgi:hypothetical protein
MVLLANCGGVIAHLHSYKFCFGGTPNCNSGVQSGIPAQNYNNSTPIDSKPNSGWNLYSRKDIQNHNGITLESGILAVMCI